LYTSSEEAWLSEDELDEDELDDEELDEDELDDEELDEDELDPHPANIPIVRVTNNKRATIFFTFFINNISFRCLRLFSAHMAIIDRRLLITRFLYRARCMPSKETAIFQRFSPRIAVYDNRIILHL